MSSLAWNGEDSGAAARSELESKDLASSTDNNRYRKRSISSSSVESSLSMGGLASATRLAERARNPSQDNVNGDAAAEEVSMRSGAAGGEPQPVASRSLWSLVRKQVVEEASESPRDVPRDTHRARRLSQSSIPSTRSVARQRAFEEEYAHSTEKRYADFEKDLSNTALAEEAATGNGAEVTHNLSHEIKMAKMKRIAGAFHKRRSSQGLDMAELCKLAFRASQLQNEHPSGAQTAREVPTSRPDEAGELPLSSSVPTPRRRVDRTLPPIAGAESPRKPKRGDGSSLESLLDDLEGKLAARTRTPLHGRRSAIF